MQRIITAAVVLLVVQIGLVAVMTSSESGYEPYTPNVPLVAFSPQEVDRVVVTATDGKELILSKNDSGWMIAGEPQVPAAADQVDDFLSRLAGFKRGLAVATSQEAAERFKVSPANFASRLRLSKGGEQLGEVFFGTSSGFKQLNTRTAESDEIYTVPLGSHEVSAEVSQWIDKDLLAVEKGEVVGVSLGGQSYLLEDNLWKAETGEGDVPEKSEKVAGLVDKLSSLNVLGRAEVDSSSPADLEVSATLKDGAKLTWSFFAMGENEYGATRSDLQFHLSVSGWQVEEMKKLQGELAEQPPSTEEEQETTPESAPESR